MTLQGGEEAMFSEGRNERLWISGASPEPNLASQAMWEDGVEIRPDSVLGPVWKFLSVKQ